MGVLDWIKGTRRKPVAARGGGPPGGSARYEITAGLIFINGRDFVGSYSRSPNGRFVLAWRDANDAGTRGGARANGHGRYMLIDGDAIVAEGRVERPNDGKVADTGVFILNDWLFFSERLAGVFLAFRKDGTQILSRRFEANLYNNGLSHDGRIAVCQTCNAEGADSSKLTIFDLDAAREIASVTPESGWARDYAFPADHQTIELCYDGDARYAYDLNGGFVDRSRWIAAGLARGDVYLIQRLMAADSNSSAQADPSHWIAGLTVALADDQQDPRLRALALKLRGTYHEQAGAPGEALRDFDAALAIDPKIGVKRRADALRRSQAGG